MRKKLPDTKACKTCRVGSCCYEGAEMTLNEMKAILRKNPKVPKPWFRLVEPHEEPEKHYPFSTIMRNGTCVFQDKDNRCLVYRIRPKHCREFPLEKGKTAPYYKRLCVLFCGQWPNNVVRRTYFQRINNFIRDGLFYKKEAHN